MDTSETTPTPNSTPSRRTPSGLVALAVMVSVLAAACATGGVPLFDASEAEPSPPDGPTATAPSTTAPPPPLQWLAVGDSYSSGEGLDDTTGRCARSPSAYAEVARAMADQEIERFVHAACTGATTGGWPSQFEQWGAGRPNLITSTFGGNDVGFVGLMADCIGLDDGVGLLEDAADLDLDLDLGAAAERLWGRGCDRPEDEVGAEIDGLGSVLEPLYVEMSDIVGRDGRVFILGYPAPLSDPDGWSRSRCDGVSRDDARLLMRAAGRLNATIRSATEVRPNVHFVDIAPAFTAHARCSPEPWLYGLGDVLERAEDEDIPTVVAARPFHPTAAGHEAMAELLTAAVSTTATNS